MMKSIAFFNIVYAYNRFAMVAMVLVMTFANFVQASSVITMAPVVDLVIHPDRQGISQPTVVILEWMGKLGIPQTLLFAMLLFLLMIIFKNVVVAFSKYILLRVSNSFVKSLIYEEYRAFLGASWPFFVEQKHGVLINTLIRETERVGTSIESIGDMISSALGIVFYLGLGFSISWKLTVVVLAMLGLGLIPFFLLGKKTYSLGQVHTNNNNDFFGAVQETIGAAKVILGYGNQKKSLEAIYKIIPNYMSTVIRVVMLREATPLAFEPFGFLIILATVFVGINFCGVKVAELLILLYAFRAINQNGLNIVARRNAVKNLLPGFEQLQRLRAEALSMVQPSGDRLFDGLQEGIVLKDVCFHYPGNKQALNGVGVVIPKGKMIAIVGRSGSGKTTLIDVLMGFYVPQEGEFLIDRIPFKDLDIGSWRRKIGYIPQDATLFNMSIKDNLLWGQDGATDQDIALALEMSHANEFVRELPSGTDTVVGEHGVRLSGGQRQRLALARAILRNPDLLFLDEATSALDSHSELLIQASIDKLAKTTTIVAVAHRLSTIKKADYIYVFDNGRIVEEGTFEQLISVTGGEFLRTAEIQGVL